MIKNNVYFLLILSFFLDAEVAKNHVAILYGICARSEENTWLFSYPRSANTWTRYCLEYLTTRPTFHRFNFHSTVNIPLGWTAGFEVNLNKPPIYKVHHFSEIQRAGGDISADTLILLVRNPKEALTRQVGKNKLLQIIRSNSTHHDVELYFSELHAYIKWNANKKIIIHYEDLIQDPVNTLVRLLDFLKEPADRLELFMQNYEAHRKTARSIYKEAVSDGNDVFFHSKKLTLEERQEIEAWIVKRHPELWDTFLKDRYSERVIRIY